MNYDEKRKKWRSEAFIEETENEGDVIRPNIGEKIWSVGLELHRWMSKA